MQYAFIEEGSVAFTRSSLPKNFKNISGFDKLSLAELKEYGVFPYEYTAPEFDPMIEKLGAFQFVIGENLVTGTREVIALSSEELAAQKASMVAQNSGLMIEFMYDTDWINLGDSGLSAEEKLRYEEMRSNMLLVKSDLNNLSLTQLAELLLKLEECKKCMCARLKTFSAKMVELEALLIQLLSE